MKSVLCVLAAFCLSITVATAQTPDYWTQPGTPTLGNSTLTTLTVTPSQSNVYATTQYYDYISTDNGISWQVLINGNDTIFQGNIFVDDAGDLYVVQSRYVGIIYQVDSLYRSVNNGATWTKIFGTNKGNGITSMAFHSATDFIVGTNLGAYRSTDAGANWNFLDGTSGLDTLNITLLATDASGNIFAQATSGSSILFRSTNYGASWNLVGSGLNNQASQIVYYGNTLYACAGGGLDISTNDGVTWKAQALNSNNGPSSITTIAVNDSGVLFFGTKSGVYTSSDGGNTCTAINKGLTTALIPPEVYSLAITSGDYLFAAIGDYGVYRSNNTTNSGYSIQNFWQYIGGPEYYNVIKKDTLVKIPNQDTGYWKYITITEILPSGKVGSINSIIIANNGNMLALVGGESMNSDSAFSELMLSTDNGVTWALDSNGLNQLYDTVIQQPVLSWANMSFLYLAPNGDIYAGDADLFRSTDNGVTWIHMTTPPINPNTNFYGLAVDNNGTIFAGVYDGVYRSNDNGNSWTQLTQGFPIPPNNYWYITGIHINENNEIFVILRGTIYRSSDGGNTFIADNYGIASSVESMAAGDSNYLYVNAGGYLEYSSNDGLTWKQLPGLGNVSTNTYGINNSDRSEIFVSSGRPNYFVFRSLNSGSSWVEADAGLPDTSRQVNAFAFGASNGKVYAGTAHGLYGSIYQSTSDYGTKSLAVKEDYASSLVPSSLLLTGYPNPAQTNATLEFALPVAAPVTLMLTNVLGETVATLLDGQMHNTGTYQVHFTMESLTPGVYFCTLRAGNIVKTMQLLVTK